MKTKNPYPNRKEIKRLIAKALKDDSLVLEDSETEDFLEPLSKD